MHVPSFNLTEDLGRNLFLRGKAKRQGHRPHRTQLLEKQNIMVLIRSLSSAFFLIILLYHSAVLYNVMFQAYPEYSEGGYADKRTVLQGDRIIFYIGNALEQFSAKVFRVSKLASPKKPGCPILDSTKNSLKRVLAKNMRVIGQPDFKVESDFEVDGQTMLVFEGLKGNSPAFGCTPEVGCDWQPTFELTIPLHWPSGWYRVAFPVKYGKGLRYIDFIVAEKEKVAHILFIFDMQTAHAYNVYAGGSFYGTIDASGRWTGKGAGTGSKQLSQLSFRRPLVRSHNYGKNIPRIADPVWIPHEEESFRLWLESNFSVAYISNDSLGKFGLEYLKQYPVIIVVGTQEYWSHLQVERIKNYVLDGGALYLSAIEFAYGAVRLEQQGEVMRYFDDPRQDPIFPSAPNEVATIRAAVLDLEDFFGVSLEQGKGLGLSDEFSDLIVVNPNSWVFEGLGYAKGDELAGMRGLGVGGWVKQRQDGRYCIVSSKIPCKNVDVLAIAPYPPLVSDDPSDPSHAKIDRLIDGRVDHTLTIMPEKTFAVVALVKQGKGTMFIGPGGWFNLRHPHNQDPRVQKMIKKVLRRFAGLDGEKS